MNTRTKIKVGRESLIGALKAKRDEERAAYEEKVLAHEAAVQDWPQRVAEAMHALADRIDAGEFDPANLYDRYGDWRRALPDMPAKPSHPKNRDMAIAQLELGVEETLMISGEDYAAYIG